MASMLQWAVTIINKKTDRVRAELVPHKKRPLLAVKAATFLVIGLFLKNLPYHNRKVNSLSKVNPH